MNLKQEPIYISINISHILMEYCNNFEEYNDFIDDLCVLLKNSKQTDNEEFLVMKDRRIGT